jgi:CheY-like chemotaxis protein
MQAQIIDQFLASARALQGTLRTEPQLIAHRTLVENAAEIARRAVHPEALQLELELDERSCLLEVDAPRRERALATAMVNAANDGPGAGPVVVSSHVSPAGIEFRIDRPAGTAPVSAEPHADTGASAQFGLDMALARQCVEMQEGRLLLRAGGRGAARSVVIRLPAHRIKSAIARRDAYPVSRGPKPRRIDGTHVVLIEDDPDALDFLALVLTQAGAELDSFSLAGPAFDFIVGSRRPPDVVVSDIAMPVEDGYSFMRRLRGWEAAHARVPVPAIAVSAFARDEDIRRAIDYGFDRHLPKPVDAMRLVDLIADWAPRRQ